MIQIETRKFEIFYLVISTVYHFPRVIFDTTEYYLICSQCEKKPCTIRNLDMSNYHFYYSLLY